MTAFYNEIDPFAAAWLKNLADAGEITPGLIGTASIAHVRPEHLSGFRRVHLFAGIGGWDYALRLAGWPDDREVWTGSCPCQPFSAAGKKGGFADERHLWPHMFRLVSACRPATVMGEQVASRDGLEWLDLVFADLEGAGYTVRAADICAASVGAPHIRQRLWWRADRMADADDARLEGRAGMLGGADQRPAGPGGVAGGLADPHGRGARAEGLQRGWEHRQQPQDGRSSLRVEHADSAGRIAGRGDDPTTRHGLSAAATGGGVRPGPTNGVWRDADWLGCRDGKWRPVEPGTFPLADGVPGRVGRLRAYGNAIVPQVAAAFIRATEGERVRLMSDLTADKGVFG